MVASHAPPTGDPACNPGLCAEWESTGDPLVCRPALNPLSHTSQGRIFLLILNLMRGLGRGQWGEGSIGATIKDTRTKSRGREVGLAGVGWGEGEKMQTIVTE